MPLAGYFPKTRQEALAAPRYPLSWNYCSRCGLVNVAPDIPDAELYADYSYATGDVPGLVRHHAEFAAMLTSYGWVRSVLDIGGNDGTLLRLLPARWFKVNVDPSDIARTRKDGDYTLINGPFGPALDIKGQFDLIVSSNAFAHFTEIGAALDAVRAALTPDGVFIVEVHDLRATLLSGQWDTIYHEHKVEWSVASLRAAGAMHGLDLFYWTTHPLHGGLIRARFKKGHQRAAKQRPPDFSGLQHAYANRRAPDLPQGFNIAYGAAGRATVYLNQVRPDLDVVLDGSPRRAGRYIPGVGLPICPPDWLNALDPSAILITAWNHAADIKARHPDYRGEWVTAWK